VKWAGLEVGGIRISHLSHIDGKMQMQLTATKGQRKPHVVMPLVVSEKRASGADTNRERAEQWLAKYEADLKAAKDTDQLADIHAAADKAIAKLAKEFPDLHERALTLRPFTTGDAPAADDPFA
jgi:hypothetical protein